MEIVEYINSLKISFTGWYAILAFVLIMYGIIDIGVNIGKSVGKFLIKRIKKIR